MTNKRVAFILGGSGGIGKAVVQNWSNKILQLWFIIRVIRLKPRRLLKTL